MKHNNAITLRITGNVKTGPTFNGLNTPINPLRGVACFHIAGVTCGNCRPVYKSSQCPNCMPRCPHGYPADVAGTRITFAGLTSSDVNSLSVTTTTPAHGFNSEQ